MMDIRLPNIDGKTEAEQLTQIKSYLYQFAEQLQWGLRTIDGGSGGSGYVPYRSTNQGGSTENPLQKAEETLKNFSELKGLIIKSADIVEAYYEQINKRLEGLYVAQSEYGTFVEKTKLDLEINSTGITQNYNNLQLVTSETIPNLEKAIQTTKQELTDIIDSTDSSLKETIEDTEQRLNATIDSTDKTLQATIAQTDSDLRGVIDQTEQTLRSVIDTQEATLRGVIEQVDADLQGVVTATEERLAGTITETKDALQDTIDQAKEDMINDIDSAEQNMNANIVNIENNLNTSITDTKEALANSISETETNMQGSIASAKTELAGSIDSARNELSTSIATTNENLQNNIDNAKSELAGNIASTKDALEENIGNTKSELEGSIESAKEDLKNLLDEVTAILVEVQAYIKSGLLYYDDYGVPVYGIEIGQTNTANGVEFFNKFARFTSDRLSFYDANDTEVAYISDYMLVITNAWVKGSLKLGLEGQGFTFDTSNGLALIPV